MKNLNDAILDRITPEAFDIALRIGAGDGRSPRHAPKATYERAAAAYAAIRQAYGFEPVAAPLLTKPHENLKLNKGQVPSYGLTLQHYVQRLSTGLTVNACPWAGACTKVCVLNNGKGGFDAVQRARRAKTEFLARHPGEFAYLLGREIALAVRKHGHILLRPNVNSDLAWHTLAPDLTNGVTFGEAVRLYGYSKDPSILDTYGWLGGAYRVAYSWNEHSPADGRVRAFVRRGGSVAVVTNRKPHQAVKQWTDLYDIVDADVTDEWIFRHGVIGDLSAKGKARSLIGTSRFVKEVY